ncbi:MAG: hypothetical protein ACJ71M_12075 [Nitrososphaeraceae archaeon]
MIFVVVIVGLIRFIFIFIATTRRRPAFCILDISGRPITNLEPLMAAEGHSVIISGDLKEFLHVHPTEEVDLNWHGGPDISFKISFPKPGLYKAWGQFQHQGIVITATGFVLKVA